MTANGIGQKVTRRQELAIAALLEHPRVEDAARAVGVGQLTLWRWRRRPEFEAAYRAARARVVEQAIGNLQAVTGEAVAALRRNLTCGVPAVEVRAAEAILEQVMKGLHLVELEARIAALERTEAEPDRTGRPACGP